MTKRKFYMTAIILLAYVFTAKAQDFVWAKQMGGDADDSGHSIVLDASGNIYATGYFSLTLDFDPGSGVANLTSAGNHDAFVSKFDAGGNFVWARKMGGSGYDIGYSLAIDASGNVYITGTFEGTVDFDPGGGIVNLTSEGYYDIFICKLDSGGNLVWAQQMGGTGLDGANSLKLDTSSNVYTAGYFEGTVDFDPGSGTAYLISTGNKDIFISKLDGGGNYIWAKQMGSPGDDLCLSLDLDTSANIYSTGYFEGTIDFDPGSGTANLTSAAGSDIYISKLDSGGDFVWAKQVGGGSSSEAAYSISLDFANNLYISGLFMGTADFDPGSGVANLTCTGNNNIFISKLDAGGNFVWAKQMGGGGHEFIYSMALDDAGNVYTTGYFEGTADFDPSSGTTILTSPGNFDVFISKIDAGGNFVWAKQLGGTSTDMGISIALDASGSVYSTGIFRTTVDFDPSIGISAFTSAGGGDIFISKLSQGIVTIEEKEFNNEFSIYPNPTRGELNVEVPNATFKRIIIYDILGRRIVETTGTQNYYQFDLSGFGSTIFFIRVQSDNEIFSTKIVMD